MNSEDYFLPSSALQYGIAPKADIIPKVCGFNQSETACGLCVGCCDVVIVYVLTLKRRRTYMNAASLSSLRHNLPSKLKLHNNQSVWNVYMWMQQYNTVIQKELFPRFEPRCLPVSGQASMTHANVARRRHCWIRYLLCITFLYCQDVSNIMIIIIVKWCSM